MGWGVVLAVWALLVFAWIGDYRAWNYGTCRKCRTQWRYFDTDSHGGKGYKCDGGHVTWVSYPWVAPR